MPPDAKPPGRPTPAGSSNSRRSNRSNDLNRWQSNRERVHGVALSRAELDRIYRRLADLESEVARMRAGEAA